MRNARNSSLMAAAAIAMMGAGIDFSTPLSRSSGNLARHPYRPKMHTALDREIAAHNAEVERRKAEKKAKRAAKTKEQP